MNARAVAALPVVDGEQDRRYLGVLSRADLLAAYERELAHEVQAAGGWRLAGWRLAAGDGRRAAGGGPLMADG